MEFGFQPRKGRLESFYYLTKKAKDALVNGLQLDIENIKMPSGNSTLFSQDYFHRKFTIDCEVAFFLAAEKAGLEVLVSDRYFDKTGSNRRSSSSRAKTKIEISKGKYLITDAIFLLQTETQKELYLFEMYNGKDTKRVVRQLRQHVEAIATGSPSIQFGINRSHRVLSVFEHEGIMDAVRKRLQGDRVFDNMQKHFFSKAWTVWRVAFL